jgi:hypothetical protein
MQGEGWIALFQRVPTSYQEGMFLVTTTGTEIILQMIVSLEPDYVVLRGRSAGSTDAGRVFILPYDQIDYAGFVRKVTEPEVRSIFGDAPPVVEATPLPAAAEVPPAPPDGEAPAPEAGGAAETNAPKKPPMSKTMLLARLRQRLGHDSKQ